MYRPHSPHFFSHYPWQKKKRKKRVYLCVVLFERCFDKYLYPYSFFFHMLFIKGLRSLILGTLGIWSPSFAVTLNLIHGSLILSDFLEDMAGSRGWIWSLVSCFFSTMLLFVFWSCSSPRLHLLFGYLFLLSFVALSNI